MKKINVLEMIDQSFLGGGQANILSLVDSLDSLRFEVAVCSRGNGPFVDEVKKRSVEHFSVPFSKKINRKIFKNIISILQNNRIDILHTHGGVAGFFGRWAARKCNIPVIIHTLHGIHYLHYRNIFLKYFYVLLERMFSRFTQALIFVSDADRDRGRKLRLASEEKLTVIKNGIDFSLFEPKAKKIDRQNYTKSEFGLDFSQPCVGTVARLHRQKGIPFLLRAARRIKKAFPKSRILIVGGGPLQKKLERMNRSLGLEDFVLFLGERKDTAQLFSLFDVFVLPSLWEGLPYVLMESAAWGKAVVATDIDGVRELIKDGETGVLVPPKNSMKLAEAVIGLIQDENYASKLGENLKREIYQRYTLSQMVDQIQDLYLKHYEKTLPL